MWLNFETACSPRKDIKYPFFSVWKVLKTVRKRNEECAWFQMGVSGVNVMRKSFDNNDFVKSVFLKKLRYLWSKHRISEHRRQTREKKSNLSGLVRTGCNIPHTVISSTYLFYA